jgi:DNA mismatch endonuclease, patch repair protein
MHRRTDTVSPEKRSEIMRAVRSRGNGATEVLLARILRRHGITGWRRHRSVVGSPDFSFSRERVAVFVDGCFWHGCPKHCRIPKTNRSYWEQKLAANRLRDRLVNRTLRKNGWRVVRIWEHALAKREAVCVRRIRDGLEAARELNRS